MFSVLLCLYNMSACVVVCVLVVCVCVSVSVSVSVCRHVCMCEHYLNDIVILLLEEDKMFVGMTV